MTRLALAVAAPFLAILVSAFPHSPPGICIGALVSLPLLAAGSLLASVRTSSLRVAACCAAGAFAIRIGGAGVAALCLLSDRRATVILATIGICLCAALLLDIGGRFRELIASQAGSSPHA